MRMTRRRLRNHRRRGAAAGCFSSLLVAFFGAACEPAPPAGATSRPVGFNQIALVGTSEDSAAWAVMKAIAGRIESEDRRLQVVFRAPKEASPTAQQALLRELRDSHVRAVCLMPVDPMSVRAEIDSLTSDGKPVVLIGTDVPDSSRMLFVGPTGMSLGEATAKACAAIMPSERRTVLLLHAGTEHPVYGPRRIGFREQVRLEPGLEIFKEIDCGGSPVEAQRIVRRQMRLYPRLGCWAFLDDWPLRNWSSRDRLVPIGCAVALCRDDPKYFDALRRGDIHAIVSFDLYECVERGIESAVRLAEDQAGEPFDVYTIPPQVVLRDDLPWHEARWARWRDGRPSPTHPNE